jgi:hypothetical protein
MSEKIKRVCLEVKGLDNFIVFTSAVVYVFCMLAGFLQLQPSYGGKFAEIISKDMDIFSKIRFSFILILCYTSYIYVGIALFLQLINLRVGHKILICKRGIIFFYIEYFTTNIME